MIYSAKLSVKILKHIFLNRKKGNSRFPYVLMLEPLFKCNLNCSGCGRIRQYRDVIDKKLTLEQCIDAVQQCQAPIISITGGEPLLHPEIKEIINELLLKKYFVYLCTNGLLLENFLDEIKPRDQLSIVVHIDGLFGGHEKSSGQNNVYQKAVNGIKKAVKLNFNVRTNTTIYRYTDIREVANLFSSLMKLGIKGVIVSPGFNYEDVNNEIFLERSDIKAAFEELYDRLDGTKVYNTPLYWEFLRAKRNLDCAPWANITFNPQGWKSPCYLITDAHFQTYREFLENTPWEKYGSKNDERCKNCMMHSGYEASAIASMRLADIPKILKWNFTGRIK